jgi:DNA-binding GntR family transcriptional regulator
MLGEFGLQSRLVEERLAVELGISRTPVREALLRLVADGLVIRRTDGYYVALPDLSQLRDLYEVRIALELRGLSRALESEAVSHDLAEVEMLRDQWAAMLRDLPVPDPQFVTVDEDFHVQLSRASGNVVLTETLASVNARIRSVRMYDYLTEDRIEATVREHLEIAELVLGERLPEALAAMHRHVGESRDVVERRAAHAITQMALHRPRA